MGEAPGSISKDPTHGRGRRSPAAPQDHGHGAQDLPVLKMFSPKVQGREKRAFLPPSRTKHGFFCPKPKEFYPSLRKGWFFNPLPEEQARSSCP